MSYDFRHWVIMPCVQYMWPLVSSSFLMLHQKHRLKTFIYLAKRKRSTSVTNLKIDIENCSLLGLWLVAWVWVLLLGETEEHSRVVLHMLACLLHVQFLHSGVALVPLRSANIFEPFRLSFLCPTSVPLIEDRKVPASSGQLNSTLCWEQVYNQGKRWETQ